MNSLLWQTHDPNGKICLLRPAPLKCFGATGNAEDGETVTIGAMVSGLQKGLIQNG
jgi:hypothetical protein